MTKVPVGRSIAHAYEFLFGRFFQIIGIAWLPAVLYAVGCYFALSNVQAWVNLSDPAAIGRTGGILLCYALLATLIRAVIAISLTQDALGIRKDITLAHFVVGPRELRLFLGLLLFYLLFAVLYAVVLAISFGLLFAARKYGAGLAPNLALHGTPVAVVASALLAVALVAWFWLSMLRLLFLLAPVASVEHRLRLARAWELTRGSTLRTFAVVVAVFLPVMIATWAILRFGIHLDAMAAQPHAKPAEALTHLLQLYSANAVPFVVLAGALAVLNGALFAGASAAAYRTLTNHEEPEPEDDVALVAPLLAADETHRTEDRHETETLVMPLEEEHALGVHDDGHGDGDQAAHGVPADEVVAVHDHRDHAVGGDDHGNATEHDVHGSGEIASGTGEHERAPSDDHGVRDVHAHHHNDGAHDSHGGHGHVESADSHAQGDAVHHAAEHDHALDAARIDREPEVRAA